MATAAQGPGASFQMNIAARSRLCWTNLLFLVLAHLLAAVALIYLIAVRCEPLTLLLGGVWWLACMLSISGGYHRLFAHCAYRASWPLRSLYLLFGAASVQNSALVWAGDHRRHHAHTDTELDPYNARRGFWWSHLGWVVFDDPLSPSSERTRDLGSDPLVQFQHKYYVPLAVLMAAAVPAGLGLLWGDPLGALLVAGFLRLVIQWHMTFSINSMAHMVGSQPYCTRTSARDSWATALFSLGEGYHNFHHRFPSDYRNGHRWYHFDTTKWFLWLMARVRAVGDLRRTSREAIQRARATVEAAARQAVQAISTPKALR